MAGPINFKINDCDTRCRDGSGAVLGGPMVDGFRPEAAFCSVAMVAPTGRVGGHCTVGQLSVDRAASFES